jgi:hypothetical protein
MEFVSTPVISPASLPASLPETGAELVPASRGGSVDARMEHAQMEDAQMADARMVNARMEFLPTPIHSPASSAGSGAGLFSARANKFADARPASDVPGTPVHAGSSRFFHALKSGIAQAFQHLGGALSHGRHDRATVQARAARERNVNAASAPADSVDSDTDLGGR